jgi:ribonuclease HI
MRFLVAFRRHKVHFKWVKGHADNKENNLCDELAVAASLGAHLKKDHWYEENVAE